MKKIDLAWAAGLIDGEGCICILKRPPQATARGKSHNYYILVKVSMGDSKAIKRLYEIFKLGSLHMNIKQKGNKFWNKYHVWTCVQRDCQIVLNMIKPYAITKKREIKVGLNYLSLPLAPRGGGSGSPRVPDGLNWKRRILWERMRRLKPRTIMRLKKMEEIR